MDSTLHTYELAFVREYVAIIRSRCRRVPNQFLFQTRKKGKERRQECQKQKNRKCWRDAWLRCVCSACAYGQCAYSWIYPLEMQPIVIFIECSLIHRRIRVAIALQMTLSSSSLSSYSTSLQSLRSQETHDGRWHNSEESEWGHTTFFFSYFIPRALCWPHVRPMPLVAIRHIVRSPLKRDKSIKIASDRSNGF